VLDSAPPERIILIIQGTGEQVDDASHHWQGSRSVHFGARLPSLIVVVMLAGCAVSAPIKDTPKVVATPHQGELSIATLPSHPIGEVEPVYVSIANGTDVPRQVVPDQIFALDADGNRIAPIPPDEAARQAGGAGALKSALERRRRGCRYRRAGRFFPA
jgi:hypothetical protein